MDSCATAGLTGLFRGLVSSTEKDPLLGGSHLGAGVRMALTLEEGRQVPADNTTTQMEEYQWTVAQSDSPVVSQLNH